MFRYRSCMYYACLNLEASWRFHVGGSHTATAQFLHAVERGLCNVSEDWYSVTSGIAREIGPASIIVLDSSLA